MVPIGLFIVGMVVLLLSTNQLITLSTKLAYSLRMSPLIIGITIVAIGTSLPELVVSSIASADHDYGLAVGNVLGSNIINVLVVLSLGILTGKLHVGTTKTQKNAFILLTASFLYIASFWLHLPGYTIALAFLGLAVVFTYTQYLWGVAGRKFEDKVMFTLSKKSKVTHVEYVYILICLALVFVGGSLIVRSVEQIAEMTGYSTNILGLSITAIATSLPEIVATLIGMRKKEDKLLLGNIMGSNIYNILLIGGISSFWMTGYYPPMFEIVFFTVAVLLFVWIVTHYRGKVVPHLVGGSLLAGSILYFVGMYFK